MNLRTRWIIAAIFVILLYAIAYLFLLNATARSYEVPPALTDAQMKVCYAMRNEEKIGDYTLVNGPTGVYWDLGHHKKRWCVRRNG